MPQIIPTPLPFIFVNGTTADATQVNSDLNTIVNNVNAFYSTGTWSPTLVGSTGNPTPTYTIQTASYEQIGRLVHISFSLKWSNYTGGSGQVGIGNLPFAIGAGNLSSAYFSEWGSIFTGLATHPIVAGQILPAFPLAVGLVYTDDPRNTANSLTFTNLSTTGYLIGDAIYHT